MPDDIKQFVDNIDQTVDALRQRADDLASEMNEVNNQLRVLAAAQRAAHKCVSKHKMDAPAQRAVLAAMQSNAGPMDYEQLTRIVERSGFAPRSVYPIMRALRLKRLVERGVMPGTWMLTEKGQNHGTQS